MENQIIQAATEIIQPVMESAIIVAGHYSKTCGRNTITSQDVQYALKYSARNLVGKHVGTLFPEDEDEDEDDDSMEEVDEEEEPFVRYSGEDSLMKDIHNAVDTWESWIPVSPIEIMLKDSVDKTY